MIETIFANDHHAEMCATFSCGHKWNFLLYARRNAGLKYRINNVFSLRELPDTLKMLAKAAKSKCRKCQRGMGSVDRSELQSTAATNQE